MRPIKIAILSLTHGHTRKYYQTLRDSPKLDWVAAYGENREVIDLFERSVSGVPCYSNEEEMFRKHPDIEAVVLASANSEHKRQTEMCAKRGIHILSMKIPTFDPDEYNEMIRLVDLSGIVFQIELEMHYNPVIYRIRKLIEADAIGRIYAFQATNITLSPVWAFPWQGVPELSYGKKISIAPGDSRFRGGALCDHPHIFDMLRWLTKSNFDFVHAEVGLNIRTDIDVEDIILVTGKMKDGTTFLLDPSWSRLEERLAVPGPGWEIFPKRMEVNMTLHGEKGVLSADCFGPNVYHNGAPNDRYTVQYTYFDEWIGMIDEFADCIRYGKQPKINLHWHRQNIDTMNACYESVATKKPVYIY
jgi:predicted dehydrogenase